MGLVTAVAIYFVIWWTVLFAVLPFGVRPSGDTDAKVLGSADSAPVTPHLARKAVATTVISAVVFAIFYVATQVYGLGVESFPHVIPGT